MTPHHRVAIAFMTQAVCEWGQPERDRIAAVQSVLNACGFDATATCFPVFGGIWAKPCEGPDADNATGFLKNLTDTMQRGKFEREVQHVEACIERATAKDARSMTQDNAEVK